MINENHLNITMTYNNNIYLLLVQYNNYYSWEICRYVTRTDYISKVVFSHFVYFYTYK